MGSRGVKGGTSSTSTSEWKIRLATARINPGMTSPTTGAGLKQCSSNNFPFFPCNCCSPTLSNVCIPLSSHRSLHWKEGLSDDARRPVEVRMCSKMASKPLKKSWRLPPTARSTRSFSSKQRPKNSSPKCSRSSQYGTPKRHQISEATVSVPQTEQTLQATRNDYANSQTMFFCFVYQDLHFYSNNFMHVDHRWPVCKVIHHPSLAR